MHAILVQLFKTKIDTIHVYGRIHITGWPLKIFRKIQDSRFQGFLDAFFQVPGNIYQIERH